MSMTRRILIAVAGVILTALYWGAAWIHMLAQGFCHRIDPPCTGLDGLRAGTLFQTFTTYLVVYVAIVCAGWIVIPLLRNRK